MHGCLHRPKLQIKQSYGGTGYAGFVGQLGGDPVDERTHSAARVPQHAPEPDDGLQPLLDATLRFLLPGVDQTVRHQDQVVFDAAQVLLVQSLERIFWKHKLVIYL